jgi:hypothetical protein
MLSVFVDQLQGEAILTALLGFGDALASDRERLEIGGGGQARVRSTAIAHARSEFTVEGRAEDAGWILSGSIANA